MGVFCSEKVPRSPPRYLQPRKCPAAAAHHLGKEKASGGLPFTLGEVIFTEASGSAVLCLLCCDRHLVHGRIAVSFARLLCILIARGSYFVSQRFFPGASISDTLSLSLPCSSAAAFCRHGMLPVDQVILRTRPSKRPENRGSDFRFKAFFS